MRLLNRLRKNRKGKRGFTLVECMVSIAIFSIMATMFATFLVGSVRVVNLSVANDVDRDMLMEAVIAAKKGDTSYETENGGIVKINAVDTKGETVVLNIDLKDMASKEMKDGFYEFEAENGTKYCIYIGKITNYKPGGGGG